jgi:hypothetical protein
MTGGDTGRSEHSGGQVAVGCRLVRDLHPVHVLFHRQAAVFQRATQSVHHLLPVAVRGSHLLLIIHLVRLR